ncbi:hypothetical protein THAOC_09839 [Thalassiosira oceanica]|uniref:Uncharacterized protein n=1 Tax=Thalassiosira oceanica TaxID=159749 RepID=K0SU41_THAOC|nr:hypothetical protein THAOC_09839 [Thalassiosira oceanica]|eukprot:EJK68940.1 hypothetical protein THAOC_09839 [Thalassiosira oceanica]
MNCGHTSDFVNRLFQAARLTGPFCSALRGFIPPPRDDLTGEVEVLARPVTKLSKDFAGEVALENKRRIAKDSLGSSPPRPTHVPYP